MTCWLDSIVTLRGSQPQERVFDALRNSDIFAIASIVDEAGASDVFPTVIQEAMACAEARRFPLGSPASPKRSLMARPVFLVPPETCLRW